MAWHPCWKMCWPSSTRGRGIELNLPILGDGSQFTTGGAENPTLTIVSLAIRQADYIAQQMTERAI